MQRWSNTFRTLLRSVSEALWVNKVWYDHELHKVGKGSLIWSWTAQSEQRKFDIIMNCTTRKVSLNKEMSEFNLQVEYCHFKIGTEQNAYELPITIVELEHFYYFRNNTQNFASKYVCTRLIRNDFWEQISKVSKTDIAFALDKHRTLTRSRRRMWRWCVLAQCRSAKRAILRFLTRVYSRSVVLNLGSIEP